MRFLTRTAALVLVVSANLSAAQRTFVSAGFGDDANPCTRPLPCRNFAAAIPGTDVNGEIVVLDSGGYGVVTITKPLAIVAPDGVYAAITAFAGNAVTVNAAGPVVLRNLHLNGQGGVNGIDADAVTLLSVESCVINGFSHTGLKFDPGTTGARLRVTDVTIRKSEWFGIYVAGGSGIKASAESLRLAGNWVGVDVSNADMTIRDSAAISGSTGFSSHGRVAIENSVAFNNGFGFAALGGGMMTLSRCTAAGNTNYGVQSNGAGSIIYLMQSTIVENNVGVAFVAGASIATRGDNSLLYNTTDGTFNVAFGVN